MQYTFVPTIYRLITWNERKDEYRSLVFRVNASSALGWLRIGYGSRLTMRRRREKGSGETAYSNLAGFRPLASSHFDKSTWWTTDTYLTVVTTVEPDFLEATIPFPSPDELLQSLSFPQRADHSLCKYHWQDKERASEPPQNIVLLARLQPAGEREVPEGSGGVTYMGHD